MRKELIIGLSSFTNWGRAEMKGQEGGLALEGGSETVRTLDGEERDLGLERKSGSSTILPNNGLMAKFKGSYSS